MYVFEPKKCCMISWRCMQAVHETQSRLHFNVVKLATRNKQQTKCFQRPAMPLTFVFHKKSPDILLPSMFCTQMQSYIQTQDQNLAELAAPGRTGRTSKMDSMYASTGSSPEARLEQLLACSLILTSDDNMVLMQCRVRISRNRNT